MKHHADWSAGARVAITLAPLLPGNLFSDGVGGVFALSVAAFVGYESALAYGEEARGHGALASVIIGSTALQVLHRSELPVTLVK